MKIVNDGDKTKNVRGNRATELLEHISALFTKEEVIAMLEELKKEIEDKEKYYGAEFEEPSNLLHETAMCGRMFGYGGAKQIIQEKIDKLKEAD